MTWKVQKWDGSSWVDVAFSDLSVSKSLDELDSATITMPKTENVARGDLIRITYDTTTVFEGYVQRIVRRVDVMEVQCLERAVELRKSIVNYGGSYTHTWVNLTVNDIVDRILDSTSWSRGSDDATIIPAISLEYVDRLTALSKVIKDMRGLHMWFEGTKVYFGSSRTDRTSTIIRYQEIEDDEDETEMYDKIIVIGGGSVNRHIVAERGSGDKVGIFEYPDAVSQEELNKIADTLYDYYSTERKRVSVTMPLWPEVNPGDLVNIDGTTYIVYDAQHDLATTRISAGYYSPSLGRILRQLRKVQQAVGRVTQGVVETFEIPLGYQHVGSGSPARWNISVQDKVLSAKLRLKLTKWKKLTDIQNATTGVSVNSGSANIQSNTTGVSIGTGHANIESSTTGITVSSGKANIESSTTGITISSGQANIGSSTTGITIGSGQANIGSSATGITIDSGEAEIQSNTTGITLMKGYADIDKASTGISTAFGEADISREYTGASIMAGGESGIVVDYVDIEPWEDLPYDHNWTFYGPDGYSFVICVVNLLIHAPSDSGTDGMCYLYWWNGWEGEWEEKDRHRYVIRTSDEYAHVTLVGVARGYSGDTADWRVRITESNGGELRWLHIRCFFVELHEHSLDEGSGHTHYDSGHSHGINDPEHDHDDLGHSHGVDDPKHDHIDSGHSHGLSDPQHSHTDSGHDHGVSDPGHGHSDSGHSHGTNDPGHGHEDSGHEHGVSDPGHGHSDSGHEHSLSDPGHNHTDSGHGHGITDPGHAHGIDNDATELSLYPSNVNVVFNGSTIAGPYSGGAETTIEIDITDYLTEGNHVLEITSDTAGGIEGSLVVEKFVRR